MVWGIRGSKDCDEHDENNEKDKNNNFDDNYKKLLRTIWQWRGPKTPTKMMKTIILSKIIKTCGMQWHQAWEGPTSPTKMMKVTIFAENDENTLRAMASGMRGSIKTPTKKMKTTNATILTKITKKLAGECNDMKDDRV